MTEEQRGALARDIGSEAAIGVSETLMGKCTHPDGTFDFGVYYAALSFAADTLKANLNADMMLSTYRQPHEEGSVGL